MQTHREISSPPRSYFLNGVKIAERQSPRKEDLDRLYVERLEHAAELRPQAKPIHEA